MWGRGGGGSPPRRCGGLEGGAGAPPRTPSVNTFWPLIRWRLPKFAESQPANNIFESICNFLSVGRNSDEAGSQAQKPAIHERQPPSSLAIRNLEAPRHGAENRKFNENHVCRQTSQNSCELQASSLRTPHMPAMFTSLVCSTRVGGKGVGFELCSRPRKFDDSFDSRPPGSFKCVASFDAG